MEIDTLLKETPAEVFSVNFAKFLEHLCFVENVFCESRSYLRENLSHMKILVTVYLEKKYLPLLLLGKQKKRVSISEVSKTLRIYKKPIPLK